MNRLMKALAAGTVVSAGAATAGLVGYGRASAEPPDPTTTLVASVPQTSTLYRPCDSCVIASTPSGAHIGGTEIDTGTLSNHNGTVVGHYSLQAVGVTPFSSTQPGELDLHAVLAIGPDQIVADGLEEPPDNGGTAAVLGGTGRYRTTRGTIVFSDQPDGTTVLQLHLVGTDR